MNNVIGTYNQLNNIITTAGSGTYNYLTLDTLQQAYDNMVQLQGNYIKGYYNSGSRISVIGKRSITQMALGIKIYRSQQFKPYSGYTVGTAA